MLKITEANLWGIKLSIADIEKIKLGKAGILPPVTVFWKDGSVQEIQLGNHYTIEQAVPRIAEIILIHPKKKELEKLRADLFRLMEAAL